MVTMVTGFVMRRKDVGISLPGERRFQSVTTFFSLYYSGATFSPTLKSNIQLVIINAPLPLPFPLSLSLCLPSFLFFSLLSLSLRQSLNLTQHRCLCLSKTQAGKYLGLLFRLPIDGDLIM